MASAGRVGVHTSSFGLDKQTLHYHSIRHATLICCMQHHHITAYSFLGRRALLLSIHTVSSVRLAKSSIHSSLTPSGALGAVSAQSFITQSTSTRRNGSRNAERIPSLRKRTGIYGYGLIIGQAAGCRRQCTLYHAKGLTVCSWPIYLGIHTEVQEVTAGHLLKQGLLT